MILVIPTLTQKSHEFDPGSERIGDQPLQQRCVVSSPTILWPDAEAGGAYADLKQLNKKGGVIAALLIAEPIALLFYGASVAEVPLVAPPSVDPMPVDRAKEFMLLHA